MGDYTDNVNSRNQKSKLKEFAEKTKKKAQETYDRVHDWCKQNEAIVVTVGPALLGAAVEIAKLGVKSHNRRVDRKREEEREYTEWDPKTGSYVKLKRPLTNPEKVEIAEKTRDDKVTKTQVLSQMGLLA